jgi:cephalosporin hydroxylase
MGIRAAKNPFDAWMYQEIIYEIKPEVIVEIGSAEGGSALYFANLLDILGKGEVISIDISRSGYKAKHPRIREITGDSSGPETIAKVAGFCSNKSVLVVHDGGHSHEQVLKDLRSYSKFVSVNSYFIVEDGIIDLFKPEDGIGSYEDGPLVAIDEFLKNNPNFVVDEEKERYILTYNPRGFLKRIR